MDEGSVGPDKLIENWASAELRGDMASLGGFLADDFIGVGPRGFKLTKEEWLDRHATRKLRYENFQFDETRVRHYGGSAVVTGRQSVVGKYETSTFKDSSGQP